MLLKMLALERTWQLQGPAKSAMRRPRQVFVTQSRILAGKVEEYFDQLSESLACSSWSEGEIAKLKSTSVGPQRMTNAEEEEHWRSDLPVRFSELRDEHFPLFVTFDKVRMIGHSSKLGASSMR
jgi:hypothetical protein